MKKWQRVEGVGDSVRTKYRNERNEMNKRLHEIGVNRERGSERRKRMEETNGGNEWRK